ncbi:unnamed protein product [Prunus armeniaca]
MGGGAVAWRSVKQPSMATSTMFDMNMKVVDSIARPIQLFCDNKGVVFFCKNNKRYAGLKHMKVKYLLVREKVREGSTSVDYINTTEILEDTLNKVKIPAG